MILSQAIESRDYKCLNEIVKLRNADHPIWGWKRPSAIDHSEVWQGCFRNPHLIAILRDPFAIANRNRISMLSDIFQNMEDSIKRLGTLVKFLCQQKNPILLCSYEKVLSSPEAFVRAVDDFLGLSANARWDEAVLQINPAPLEYLENSRITQSVGRLEIANERFCGGWAFYRHQPTKPLDHWEVSRVSAVVTLAPVFTLLGVQAAARLWPEAAPAETLSALNVLGALLVVAGSMTTALGARTRPPTRIAAAAPPA